MKSLNRALDILEIFLEIRDNNVRLTDLAKASGMQKATVSRIAAELIKRGYLTQTEKRGKYSLGPQFLYFSEVIRQKTKIREIALPYLTKLSQTIDETVILANWDGKKVSYVDELPANSPLRIIPDQSMLVQLHASGVGKIFLAAKTEAELEEYFRNTTLKSYTPNTITDINHLKSHLRIIAREGVAYDDEEQFIGIRNVVAAIKEPGGRVVSCVGVLGPSVRLTRTRMAEITPTVKRCAMEISAALGYREDSRRERTAS